MEQAPMTTTEVAELFRVTPFTVARWAREGRLDSFRTPGGDYRFPRDAVERAMGRRTA